MPWDAKVGIHNYTEADWQLAVTCERKPCCFSIVNHLGTNPENAARIYNQMADIFDSAVNESFVSFYDSTGGNIKPVQIMEVDNAERTAKTQFCAVGFSLIYNLYAFILTSNAPGWSALNPAERANGAQSKQLNGRPLRAKRHIQLLQKQEIDKVFQTDLCPTIAKRINSASFSSTADKRIHALTAEEVRETATEDTGIKLSSTPGSTIPGQETRVGTAGYLSQNCLAI